MIIFSEWGKVLAIFYWNFMSSEEGGKKRKKTTCGVGKDENRNKFQYGKLFFMDIWKSADIQQVDDLTNRFIIQSFFSSAFFIRL